VIPPEGFQLQPRIVPWQSLRAVEFVDWGAGAGSFTRAKIDQADGSVREVFLWDERWDCDCTQKLDASDIKIVGMLSIAGKMQESEFNSGNLNLLKLILRPQ
jgi:hypothetical protein